LFSFILILMFVFLAIGTAHILVNQDYTVESIEYVNNSSPGISMFFLLCSSFLRPRLSLRYYLQSSRFLNFTMKISHLLTHRRL